METIMSLVLEESEDISVELLSPLLASVKKGDEVNYLYQFMAQALCLFPSVSVNELTAFTVLQEALPVAQKLGEKVLETCATKVKPYLIQAVKSLGVSLDDYSDIVGSLCQEISGSIEQKDVHAGDENKVSLLCC
jgi:nitrate reductase NapE component